jgi:hypothetical protein
MLLRFAFAVTSLFGAECGSRPFTEHQPHVGNHAIGIAQSSPKFQVWGNGLGLWRCQVAVVHYDLSVEPIPRHNTEWRSSDGTTDRRMCRYRPCDARSDDDGNRAALLSDLREYRPERWPCLTGYFNVEVAKYEATSGAENQG